MRQNSGVLADEFDDECGCSGVFDSFRFVLDDEVRLSMEALDFILNTRERNKQLSQGQRLVSRERTYLEDRLLDLLLIDPSRVGFRGGAGR